MSIRAFTRISIPKMNMLRRTHTTGLCRDGVTVETIASALGSCQYSDNKRPLYILISCTEAGVGKCRWRSYC